MELRSYDKTRDRDSILRVWRETGWLKPGREEMVDCIMEAGRTWVAEIDGSAEAEAATASGTVRYLDAELPLAAVTAVATSYVGRKKGLASRLTALAVANEAEQGALVAGLGMFEQGYYNRLGFGTGAYEHHLSFDPSRLNLATKARTPRRLGPDDWPMLHTARLNRTRSHGACTLLPPQATRAAVAEHPENTGLGYFDGANGALSHFIWIHPGSSEHGPCSIQMLVYQNGQQFLELLALLRDLGDQIYTVRMREPFGVQLQDFLQQPFKNFRISDHSSFEGYNRTSAFWQMRMLDIPGCLQRTHLPGSNLRFNLTVSDPITRLLAEEQAWRGVAGEYTVTLGDTCEAALGHTAGLPMLRTSINALTRLWLGVRPASGLAISDDLAASPSLLHDLDWNLRVPSPLIDWDY